MNTPDITVNKINSSFVDNKNNLLKKLMQAVAIGLAKEPKEFVVLLTNTHDGPFLRDIFTCYAIRIRSTAGKDKRYITMGESTNHCSSSSYFSMNDNGDKEIYAYIKNKLAEIDEQSHIHFPSTISIYN